MASERFMYLELWERLKCDGGVRMGFLGVPVQAKRQRRIQGPNAYTFAVLSNQRHATNLRRYRVVREVVSTDGATVREWVISGVTVTETGPLVVVQCVDPLELLLNYPVTLTDGDSFVTSETGAVQLPASTLLNTFIRSNTPAWVGTGTVDPAGLYDVGFSGDNALSGQRKVEDITDAETQLRRNGDTGYLIDLLTAIGASAPPLYVRPGKNLDQLTREDLPGFVTRVNTILGAASDEGPSGIAWAYMQVEATSGAGPFRVKLKCSHGGPGPIGFDDQLNHANLPGGANSLYLAKRDGTFIQITDSVAATQEIEVSSLTAISVGDRVRIVASATGKHLTSLDHPAAAATYGVVGGRVESAWDDTVIPNANVTQAAWANPAVRPDGWTGTTGTLTQLTAANTWLTAGKSLQIVLVSKADGTVIHALPPVTHYIHRRKTTWCVAAWIRLTALTAGGIGLRLKVGSTVIGSTLLYQSPLNAWRQLKIEGLDLSAFADTAQSITIELVAVRTTSGTLVVDSMWGGPALTTRPVLEGSGGARIWQEINRFLADQNLTAVTSHRLSLLDLAGLGVAGQQDVTLGGTVEIRPTTLAAVSSRIVELDENPLDPKDTEVVISSAPKRFTKTAPVPITVPFFEPVDIRAAAQDTTAAALICKVITPLNQTTTQLFVSLTVMDTRGGAPTVTAVALGGAVITGGSGAGPWDIDKPAAGAGVGRVVFTATLGGRTDAWDAVDVPEQVPAAAPAIAIKATVVSTNAAQMVVRVSAADGTAAALTGTINYDGSAPTVTPVTGQTLVIMNSINSVPAVGQYVDFTITRPAFAVGTGRVQFTATATGRDAGTLSVEVPAQERDTLALSARLTLTTKNATTVVYTVAVIDPFPPGGASVSLAAAVDAGSATLGASTLTPTNSFGTTGTTTLTVDRPNANTPARRVTLTATDTTNGRIAATDAAEIPAQDGPTLDLTAVQVSDTTWKVTWTATGTVEVSKNGAAYGTPAAAGLTSGTAFNRPAYGASEDVYAFRVTNGGAAIANTVSVPAATVLTGHSITITTPFGVDATPGATRIDLAWSSAGMPSGTTFDVEWQNYSAAGAFTGAEGYGVDVTSTYSVTPSPAFVESNKVRCVIYAKHQGKVILTKAVGPKTATF